MILSYYAQLESLARQLGVSLEEAFAAAGVANTTFWRVKTGRTQLRHDTAAGIAADMIARAAAAGAIEHDPAG
jgi:hypothetical protein